MTTLRPEDSSAKRAEAGNESGRFIMWLPRMFWGDHFDRCFDHEGVRRELETKGNRVLVELDRAAFDDLLSDAEHYTHQNGPDGEGLGPLKRSAAATLKAIARQS